MRIYLYIIFFIFTSTHLIAQNISIANTCTKSKVKKGFYNWTIFVKANDSTLNTIDHVNYLLDPTFRNPSVSSYDKKSNFSYKAVGWGEFEIKIVVFYKDKTKTPVNYTHWLRLR